MAPARASSSVPTRDGIRSARQAAAAPSATSSTRAWADTPSGPGAGRIAQPEHHGDEPAAIHRDPERPGSHRGLGRVGVGLADDAGDQRAVSLPVQAFLVPGEQAAERQRGGGPLDEHGVRAARRAVADQDHAAPVLAPRADRGEKPPCGLVEDRPPGCAGCARSARSARSLERAAAPGEAGQQPRGIGAARLAGQHPVRQVGQDHRPAGQVRGLPNDLVRRRARHGKFGEDLVQPFRRAQFLELRVDDPGVHRLGDLDERDLALEGDQRQPAVGGGPDQNAEAGTRRTGGPAPPPGRSHLRPRGPKRSEPAARLGGQRDPVVSTSSPPCSRCAASANSSTCTQRTRAPRPPEPATTCGLPRRITSRPSRSPTVGSMTRQETTCKASQ